VYICSQKKGHKCSLFAADDFLLYQKTQHQAFLPPESDMIISLGGDGAVLRAAQTAIAADKPLLGINSGRLGYLCAMSFSDLELFDEKLSECCCTKRNLLEITTDEKTHLAVNDVLIAKKYYGETVDININVEKYGEIGFRGDGVVIATPTGSTAYNLSAGGPVLAIDSGVFAVTPICPHMSSAKPIVIRDDRELRISSAKNKVGVYTDGCFCGSIPEQLTIKKSKCSLQIYSEKVQDD